MENYEQQVEQFLKDTETTLTIELIGEGKNRIWGDKESRFIYRFTIKNAKASYSGKFYGSIYDYRRGKNTQSAYDVLACLTKYEPPTTTEAFAREYGYPIDTFEDFKKAKAIHGAVLKEWKGVSKLWNAQQLEALQEIN